jgi:hypothetical protein
MARKYLNEIGLPDYLIAGWLSEDERWPKWNAEINEYGFASFETWSLDFQFYGWLYERLKMYLEVNCVDLTFHKFEYDGEEYTQEELINKMIYGCELVFTQEVSHKKLTEEEEKAVEDVRWIWATVMPAMWW